MHNKKAQNGVPDKAHSLTKSCDYLRSTYNLYLISKNRMCKLAFSDFFFLIADSKL